MYTGFLVLQCWHLLSEATARLSTMYIASQRLFLNLADSYLTVLEGQYSSRNTPDYWSAHVLTLSLRPQLNTLCTYQACPVYHHWSKTLQDWSLSSHSHIVFRYLEPHAQPTTKQVSCVLEHLGIPTTRESYFHVFQNIMTLAKTPNWQNWQLSLQPFNQISSATIPTDIVRYLDVDARQSHLRVSDYHTLDIDIIFF